MPNNAEELLTILGVAAVIVTPIAWFLRLEAKVLYLEKDHVKHVESVKENERLMWKKIEELQFDTKQVLQTLGRIEERLNHFKKDQ